VPEMQNPSDTGVRLKQAVEELNFLNEVALKVGRAGSAEEAEKAIITTCVERLKAEQGALWKMNTEEVSPLATVARVFEGGIPGLPVRLNLQILDWIQRQQAPLLSNDLASDTRFKHGPQGPPSGLRSILAVPLFHHNVIMGLLAVVNSRSPGGFTEDDQRLLGIIGIQCAQLLENARLATEERHLHELQKELDAARQIQRSLLPAVMPVVAGYDFAGWYEPARQVGGDLYHAERTDDEVHLAVADVSGKGLPACLYMVNVVSNMRALAAQAPAPSALLAQLNKTLITTMTFGRFVTLFFASLNVKNDRITYSNGGHNPALLVRRSLEVEWLNEGGTLLGLLPDVPFESGEATLNPGDRLILYSDGVTEAMGPDSEMFGEDRLMDAVREVLSSGRSDPTSIVQSVLDAVRRHEAGGPAMDDKTVLVVGRN
jgi:serine phosphatase RsbU (regulator of sigma subunit)